MKKYSDFIKENLDSINNDFQKKYEPVDWISDGVAILNKIGNNLTSRFNELTFKINTDGEVSIDLTQGDNHTSFIWDFDDVDFIAKVMNNYGDGMINMNDIDYNLTQNGFIK